jgi:hypothetical protein
MIQDVGGRAETTIVRGLLQYLAPNTARHDVQLNHYNAAASPLAASCFPNASRAKRDGSEVLSERVGTVFDNYKHTLPYRET